VTSPAHCQHLGLAMPSALLARANGMFSRTDFAYDAERDVYICHLSERSTVENLRNSS
jgi:hypothetical protein